MSDIKSSKYDSKDKDKRYKESKDYKDSKEKDKQKSRDRQKDSDRHSDRHKDSDRHKHKDKDKKYLKDKSPEKSSKKRSRSRSNERHRSIKYGDKYDKQGSKYQDKDYQQDRKRDQKYNDQQDKYDKYNQYDRYESKQDRYDKYSSKYDNKEYDKQGSKYQDKDYKYDRQHDKQDKENDKQYDRKHDKNEYRDKDIKVEKEKVENNTNINLFNNTNIPNFQINNTTTQLLEQNNLQTVNNNQFNSQLLNAATALNQGASSMGTINTFNPNCNTLGNIDNISPFNCDKCKKELYVGNIPPNITVPKLMEYVNYALHSMKLTISEGLPVTSAWISADCHYAFLGFRSIEESTNALSLNGSISIEGRQIKVGRPKKTGVHTHRTNNQQQQNGINSGNNQVNPLENIEQQNYMNILSQINLPKYTIIMFNLPTNQGETEINSICKEQGTILNVNINIVGIGTAAITQTEFTQYNNAKNSLNGQNIGGKYISCLGNDNSDINNTNTSKIIKILDGIDEEDMDSKEEIEEAITDECKQQGEISSVRIVENGKYPYILVEYKELSGANKAYENLKDKKFADKIISIEQVL